ncbi:hypothetical protein [Pseudoduganella lutea]|uniref:hypothetical protein n=1 Tax=Pseudoduganella lutea TaxID=321985 RepID=UPI0013EE85C7|nr:hypothetical protein [Pseudoduganella lutea]
MNESVSTSKPAPRERDNTKAMLRADRMQDLHKKHVKTGAVAAGGLLALVGLAAVLLGA